MSSFGTSIDVCPIGDEEQHCLKTLWDKSLSVTTQWNISVSHITKSHNLEVSYNTRRGKRVKKIVWRNF